MTSCDQCGSASLSVRVPVEQIYAQGSDGRWTDDGIEGVDERARWYCYDCGFQWEAWFEEDVEESGSQCAAS